MPSERSYRQVKYNPEIFLVAAEMVATREPTWRDELKVEPGPPVQWCCDAIREACKQVIWMSPEWQNAARVHVNAFERIFKPTTAELKETGCLSPSVWWARSDRESRLIALNMAAAIAQSPYDKGETMPEQNEGMKGGLWAIKHAIEDINDESDNAMASLYEGYRGRGMSHECYGIDVDARFEERVIEIAVQYGLRGAKADSLGRSQVIIYWPSVRYTSEEGETD